MTLAEAPPFLPNNEIKIIFDDNPARTPYMVPVDQSARVGYVNYMDRCTRRKLNNFRCPMDTEAALLTGKLGFKPTEYLRQSISNHIRNETAKSELKVTPYILIVPSSWRFTRTPDDLAISAIIEATLNGWQGKYSVFIQNKITMKAASSGLTNEEKLKLQRQLQFAFDYALDLLVRDINGQLKPIEKRKMDAVNIGPAAMKFEPTVLEEAHSKIVIRSFPPYFNETVSVSNGGVIAINECDVKVKGIKKACINE